MGGAENPDDEFRPPLPMEDRLWRHPSEVAAEGRVQDELSVSTVRTPWKQAVGLATAGALGGALVVTGLFLTLGGGSAPAVAGDPIISTMALDPIVPVVKTAPAEQWADEVVQIVRPGVAELTVSGPLGTSVGTGVFIRSDGVMLTSYDLVIDATTVKVVLDDGSSHDGTILGHDNISGLAVVDIEAMDTPTAPLAIAKPPPHVGDYAVSVPGLSDAETLSLRTIAARAVNMPVRPDQDLHGLIQLDGGMEVMSSGAAVVDDAGAVIGIAVDMDAENATYAVPIAYARKIAEDIIRYGEAKHSWLGIKGVDIGRDEAPDADLDGAVRVTSVIAQSPAHRAQLRKGDVITSIDGNPVLSMTELILELRRNPPETVIELRFLREGLAFRVDLTLAVRHVGDTT